MANDHELYCVLSKEEVLTVRSSDPEWKQGNSRNMNVAIDSCFAWSGSIQRRRRCKRRIPVYWETRYFSTGENIASPLPSLPPQLYLVMESMSFLARRPYYI